MLGLLLLIPVAVQLVSSAKLYPRNAGLQESIAVITAGREKLRSCFFSRPHKEPKLCGKTPLLAGWQEKASSDPGTVEEWFRRWEGANLGVLLEDVLAVDPDSDAAQDEVWDLGLDGGLARYSRQKAYLFRRPPDCPIHNVIRWG